MSCVGRGGETCVYFFVVLKDGRWLWFDRQERMGPFDLVEYLEFSSFLGESTRIPLDTIYAHGMVGHPENHRIMYDSEHTLEVTPPQWAVDAARKIVRPMNG